MNRSSAKRLRSTCSRTLRLRNLSAQPSLRGASPVDDDARSSFQRFIPRSSDFLDRAFEHRANDVESSFLKLGLNIIRAVFVAGVMRQIDARRRVHDFCGARQKLEGEGLDFFDRSLDNFGRSRICTELLNELT